MPPRFGFSIRSFGSWGEAPGRRHTSGTPTCFSIRSFGSWGEATGSGYVLKQSVSFSIRSFGSWGEAQGPAGGWPAPPVVSVSALSDRGVRLADQIKALVYDGVSVSALSDRGVRHDITKRVKMIVNSFSIRSFGSWGEARTGAK